MYCTTHHGAATDICVSTQCAAICSALWLATTRYSSYNTFSNIANKALLQSWCPA